MKSQFDFLDIARGIAILAVVNIHVSALYLAANVNPVIYFFHQLSYFCVPLFIGISGFLHAVSNDTNRAISKFSLVSYTQRRFMRLIVPYLLFSILYVSIRICLEHLPASGSLFPHRFNKFGTVISAIFLVKGNPAGQLYFLPLLFFIAVLFKILEVTLGKYRSLLILLCLAVSIFSYCLWGDIYRSLNPLKGVGFYAAGYFMYGQRSMKPYLLRVVVVGTGCLFLFGIFLPQRAVIQFIHQSCGAAFIFCSSLLLSQSAGRNYLGTGLIGLGHASLPIYLIHEPYIVTVLYLSMTKLINILPIVAFAVTAFFGIAIPILLNMFFFAKSAFITRWFFGGTVSIRTGSDTKI